MSSTKIDIVSGFLGAGKTTFIKKLLGEALANEKLVLIENEFGEIGIDGGFLKSSGIEIKEMNSGCICCSLVGDFKESLTQILTTYTPDRIIIEPSGVGKLSDVLKAVAGVEDQLRVEQNCAITVVDVKKCKLYMKNFGEFFNNQIECATTIVLSRTDIAEQKVIDEAVELIRTINKNATIITTPISELDGTKLLEILESPVDLKGELLASLQKEDEHEHHHHEHECCGHHHEHEEEHECCGHHHEHEEGHEDCEHHHEHDHEHEHAHNHEGCCGHNHEHDHEHDECGCGHHHHHHDADEIFTSWGLEQVAPVSEEKLKTFLDKIANTNEYGMVVRAKGMLPSSDKSGEWFYFDMVPGEVEIRKDKPDYTGKLCIIGSELNEEMLTKEFKA